MDKKQWYKLLGKNLKEIKSANDMIREDEVRTLGDFIKLHTPEIDAVIRKNTGDNVKIDDATRRYWVIKDHDLWKQAKKEGMMGTYLQGSGLKESVIKEAFDFNTAKSWAAKSTHLPVKVTYGTKSKKFHFIDQSDRDYDTTFAVSPAEFMKFKDADEAIKRLTAPARI